MSICLKYLFTLILVFLAGAVSMAQKRMAISGYVSDAATGERLNGATVLAIQTRQGALTNDYGFFSLSTSEKKLSLAFSFIGYRSDTLLVDPTHKQPLEIALHRNGILSEIKVSGTMPIEQRNDISTITLNMTQIEKLPSFLGEKDLLKAVQLLPGVQTGQEGSTGLYVRGGGPDENLILLDGVPVYNVSHLFGFVSVFTPEAVQSVKLIKGGFPARYGGRLSSILDIKMKEGDLKQYKGDASIGLLSSKLTFQGPFKKDISSFIISARRSYWDILASPLIHHFANTAKEKNGFGYHFQDLNAKFNYKLGTRNKLYLSLYTGNDRFHVNHLEKEHSDQQWSVDQTHARLQWGNITGALRWNTQWSSTFFSNATVSYSRFSYTVGGDINETNQDDSSRSEERYSFGYYSRIRDWSLKWDADYYPAINHAIRFGFHLTRHHFSPGASVVKEAENGKNISDRKTGSAEIGAGEYAIYAEDNFTISKRLQMNIGLHGAAYHVNDTTFLSLQPRLTGRFLLPKHWSLKFGFATMNQPLHLLTSSGIGLPTDIWVPATKKVIPETSVQYTIGAAKSLPWHLDLSVEGYYKQLHHVIAYKDGASFTNTTSDWESKIYAGRGEAWGMEFLLTRSIGRISGWLGYTLAWNNRQFSGLNNGDWFPYKYDRRHDIKLVLTYALTDHIDLSATWVYNTGNAFTLPMATYPAPGNDPVNYGFSHALFGGGNDGNLYYIPQRNQLRMRAFHRLNTSIDFKKQKKHGTRIWNVSFYNIYCRENPFFYYYKILQDGSRELKQFSLLPIMPSVSYEFRFL